MISSWSTCHKILHILMFITSFEEQNITYRSCSNLRIHLFLSSYEELRKWLFEKTNLQTMSHNGRGVFGSDFGSCAFTFQKAPILDYKGVYKRLFEKQGSVSSNDELDNIFKLSKSFYASANDFKKIPGSPVAYWVSHKVRAIFETSPSMGDVADARQGLATADNNRFLRFWQEVAIQKVGFGMESRDQAKLSAKKWFPYNKGGEFRKWYGNQEYLINWENDGKELFDFMPNSVIRNPTYYFKPSIGWSFVSSSYFGVRYYPKGFIFDVGGSSLFPKEENAFSNLAGFLCSHIAPDLMKVLNPTLNFQVGNVEQLPYVNVQNNDIGKKCIEIAKIDWDSYETSWDFTQNPIIRTGQLNLEQAFNTWQQQNADAVAEMKRLEEENNKLFIEAYGLQDELTPDVPDEQITLTRADREKDSQRLVSYALGCMMGRYSLDEPGLIYAHAGNQDFDASRYQKFPADADGIIPLTEMHWFEDDATHRIQEFLTAVWGKDTLDTNMQWLAESLDKKASETAEDTIRRYLASKFYKDHMQTYKKRPIYWLFSSGKQGAFQALVYLHRYNESTLARMRTEYVMPLISKMAAYANSLETAKESSDSAAEIKRIEKKLQDLHKQQAELSTFEEKLRHYADQRITLDLDDGVKVNYGKFGDLLADVKAVTGEK
ncbi:BREX-1 system adenine-specific DNA-methyltransferase PglX [Acinetobacter sp. YH16038]|uniref:BREX-1 system adenine-specific DNA-methyltransferase PglX n=1 Tax=Acinetobacter sp. YH16038 TaxID=2601183 RepID=UPI0015D446B2|nr:BREX-1 system adenine-specific DNA-methyltransferase PglX [Acinetobacter sp. YH16038]